MDQKTKHILTHFKSVDPLIYDQLLKMDFKLLIPHVQPADYFPKLCREIIGQQLAGKAADAICLRFDRLLGKKITPEKVLVHSAEDFRAIGLSWAKAKYVLDLAGKVNSGEVDLLKLQKFSDSEVIAELVKVKGIGLWTAEMFLLFTLGREDIFSFGDLGLQNGFKKLYPRRKLISQSRKWVPYRSYACLALWHIKDTSITHI